MWRRCQAWPGIRRKADCMNRITNVTPNSFKKMLLWTTFSHFLYLCWSAVNWLYLLQVKKLLKRTPVILSILWRDIGWKHERTFVLKNCSFWKHKMETYIVLCCKYCLSAVSNKIYRKKSWINRHKSFFLSFINM